MLNRFTQMLRDGIAPIRYKQWGKSMPDHDPMVISYNNTWGVASDTHMDKDGDRYIITGSLIRDPKIWDVFVSVTTWRCVDFKETVLDWLDKNGWRGTYDILNGDPIWAVVRKENKSEE